MRPTLQDMASILNLAKSTVSRALAGDPRVAEAYSQSGLWPLG